MSQVDEPEIADLDMSLDKTSQTVDLKSDEPMPNIWTLDESSSTQNPMHPPVVMGDNGEDDLDRPSFLRRLKGFTKHPAEDKTRDDSEHEQQ
jgi:hypothetical protein